VTDGDQFLFPVGDVMAALPLPADDEWPEGVWDTEVWADRAVSVLAFAPHGRDYQSPHDRDELYVVVRGSGTFSRDREMRHFGPGDLIVVPAGVPHRFEEFTDDLFTWVVFWGPS